MISAQTELGSTRPSDELHSPLCTPNIDLNGASSHASVLEVMERLNGHFSADVTHILHTSSQTNSTHIPQKPIRNDDESYGHKQYVLTCLRAKNIDGAINFVERHIPELTKWLHVQIKRFAPHVVTRIQQTSITSKSQASVVDVRMAS